MATKPRLQVVSSTTRHGVLPSKDFIQNHFPMSDGEVRRLQPKMRMLPMAHAPLKTALDQVETHSYLVIIGELQIGRRDAEANFREIHAFLGAQIFIIPGEIQRLAFDLRSGEELCYIPQPRDELDGVISSKVLVEADKFEGMTQLVENLIIQADSKPNVALSGRLIIEAAKGDNVLMMEAHKFVRDEIKGILRNSVDIERYLTADKKMAARYFKALGAYQHYGFEQKLDQALRAGVMALGCLTSFDTRQANETAHDLLNYYFSIGKRLFPDKSPKEIRLHLSMRALVVINAHYLEQE